MKSSRGRNGDLWILANMVSYFTEKRKWKKCFYHICLSERVWPGHWLTIQDSDKTCQCKRHGTIWAFFWTKLTSYCVCIIATKLSVKLLCCLKKLWIRSHYINVVERWKSDLSYRYIILPNMAGIFDFQALSQDRGRSFSHVLRGMTKERSKLPSLLDQWLNYLHTTMVR